VSTSTLDRPPAGVPPTAPQVGALGRLAGWAHRRRGTVVLIWLAAVIATIGLSAALAGEFRADYTARGSDSRTAQELLADRFPAQAGETVDVVVRTAGPATEPTARAEVGALLGQIGEVGHVRGVSDPYREAGAIAPDGRTVRATVQLDVATPDDMPIADTAQIIGLAERAERPGLDVALGGQVVQVAQQGEIGSEGIGLAAAALILLLVFGSVVAAGLPIVVAVIGLAISSSLVGLFAALIDVPDWSTSLAAMMGIGVGIDYVLLMVTRYREYLAQGMATRSATMASADTAGRAVLVAGGTVIISLLGLFAMGLTAMRGAAVVTIAAVAVVVLASVTLFPALLGYVGTRIDRLRLPGLRPGRAEGSPAWARWSRLVQRRPWTVAGAGFAILAILTLPVLGIRFGFPDAGNDAESTTTRQAYGMLADGFGAGSNGPLLLAAELSGPADRATLTDLAARLAGTPGVAAVLPPQLNPAGDTAVLTVVPTTSPQSAATEQLVRTLRDTVVPAATDGTGLSVYIGGATAAAIDSTEDTAARLPLLLAGVVGLSFLLLLTVFRSVAVAVKAAALNLLSLGAAYGVVGLVLEGGWAGRLVGIDTPTPLPAFIPVLMFAVLFGLSMDYEVFLLARIREHWVRSDDHGASVAGGLAATARVITAAAAIMIAVFAAFVPSPDVILKVIGVGMAAAILIDATVVRLLLVPAVMMLVGRRIWWLPAWLDRRLPRVRIEGRDDHAQAQAPAPIRSRPVLEPTG
jgi:putative drug exporter of the RND superfamily